MDKKELLETIEVIIKNTQGIELTEQYMNRVVRVAVKSLIGQLINSVEEKCAIRNNDEDI